MVSVMTIHTIDKKTIYSYLGEINDPEVPVLSIIDLGIVRDVKMNDEELEVIITPTLLPIHYSSEDDR